ncbi:hypothetical protein DICPUDRAFT_79161 [Dictyostelium purpureum]|uniref:EamA domain-containing protein n=1 Tax=Dictyostelium purpureum TaxID=5786 RepID=F0ZLR5_DICPU|nr:uncharacterized protein DICPUDRAFT_79161 [Dictyostelium purpureum]EGC35104.1 hypothetical protein DICPUDRAFT_79161 [Dictyostelium purpureum]|eukprot:XP_003288356.1 hypothetical protein DICPUDRAFT_79161 [Dictyostelium purpureum]
MDLLWLVPLIIGAVLWAGCDVISDAVIGEQDEEKEKSEKDDIEKNNKDGDEEKNMVISTENKATTPTGEKLTGEQDAIISGIVMFFLGIFIHSAMGTTQLYEYYDTYIANDGFTAANSLERISPTMVTWAALIGGVFQCGSLIYLLKSFESSSSTIIVPMIQLNSIIILPLSIILSILSYYYPILSTFHKIITPTHLFAFTLIFFGSFYPSLEGDFSQLSKMSFWKQKAVSQVLLSDFLIAIYYLIVSFCTNETGAMSSKSFLVVSTYGNCLTFGFLILFVRSFRRSAITLLKIPRKYIYLSAIGEILSLSGYFFVSISYHLYYNSGIVSAAEGALNQFFNLIVAILLKKFLNFGRDVKRVREKVFSCIIVSIGLILTT